MKSAHTCFCHNTANEGRRPSSLESNDHFLPPKDTHHEHNHDGSRQPPFAFFMSEDSLLPKKVVRYLKGHSGRITAVRFTSTDSSILITSLEDGSYCMSCGQDRSICLWNPFRDDMKDGFLIKRYKGPHSNSVNDVSM